MTMREIIDMSTLWIKNLPPILSAAQIKDLLTLYKAQSVKYLGNSGKMKHSAFATFPSRTIAREALVQLHQMSLLNHVLQVEYAKSKEHNDSSTSNRNSDNLTNLVTDNCGAREPQKSASGSGCDVHHDTLIQTKSGTSHGAFVKQRHEHNNQDHPKSKMNYTSTTWNLSYNFDDQTNYRYPLPTEETLLNIVHCMASVPKFYFQVLHLMNKMHLPPPFGELTTRPPSHKSSLASVGLSISSSEESELESSDDTHGDIRVKEKKVHSVVKKRSKALSNTELYAKRLRSQLSLSNLAAAPSNTTHSGKGAAIQDVFEVTMDRAKQTQLSLPAQVVGLPAPVTGLSAPVTGLAAPVTGLAANQMDAESASPDTVSSFGKMNAVNITVQDKQAEAVEVIEEAVEMESLETNAEEMTTPYITARELRDGVVPEEEVESYPLLHKYSAGEPCSRLYIKNLAKQTTLDQLKYIFGRYVDWNSESEADIFNIRHMTEGRMKGQAFVTLPNIEATQAAVTECHTYRLNGRPMIVAYGKVNT